MRQSLSLFSVACLTFPIAAQAAPPGQLLHQLNITDGSDPENALLLGASGALYGTANTGGADDAGTVFELTPPAPGQPAWQPRVLHTFTFLNANPRDGAYPAGSLVADAQGDLFGTAFYGGDYDMGIVFELSPPTPGHAKWRETIIDQGTAYPNGGVIIDAAGALYGVQQGASVPGFAFKLIPPPAGQVAWTEQALHVFNGGADGLQPSGGLAADNAGNVYGVTEAGGAYGFGTVYELSPPSAGQTAWTETILHSFAAHKTDGALPTARLAIDAAGVLYGTAEQGGARNNDGIAFSLTPPASPGGPWSYAVIFNFVGANGNGSLAGLTIGNAGALLGTSSIGGRYGKGLVYQLTPAAGQTAYTQTVLYEFTGGPDGGHPYSTPIADQAGNLYTTAAFGGKGCPNLQGCGTVIELFH